MTLSHEPTVARLFKMPKSLSDAIRTYAYAKGITDTDLVREAICHYIGISNPTVHGNTKYATQEERIIARRKQHKARRVLAKQLAELSTEAYVS